MMNIVRSFRIRLTIVFFQVEGAGEIVKEPLVWSTTSTMQRSGSLMDAHYEIQEPREDNE